jgi:uncharacterized RDD family membrane protein YckC
MSYGSTPPPGDDRPDPTQNPEEHPGGYGSPPPPPPQYGTPPPPLPPQHGGSTAAPQYGAGPADAPPPPPYGAVPADAPPPPPPAPGGYGQAPPPPAYEQQGYGPAPAYVGPYGQGGQLGQLGTLAQWPQRALGWLIDFVALAIPGWILYSIGGPKVDTTTGVTTAPNFFYWLGVLYFLALAIYNRWYRGGTTGQTIGRGVAGVTLVKESTGQPVGMAMAFVRDLAHIVDSIICYVGWLFPLWDVKRQTLADKIMSTVVITARKG